MRRPMSVRSCVIAFISSLLIAAQAQSQVCQSSLPANIDAGITGPGLLDLLQRSQTFREQCRRIAAVDVLRVSVSVAAGIEFGARAETTIRRYEAGALRAAVVLRFSGDYIELLAHEFEHILEQVDGVRLRDEAGRGAGWLTASGAYETRRAQAAGERVKQEAEPLRMESVHASAGHAPALRHPLD
jgi:hypothetical protein